MDALDAIHARRSTGRLSEPAPTDAELVQLLEAAVAAPDHGDLHPFRFTVLRAEGLAAFGAVLEYAYRARCADVGEPVVEAKATKERTKLGRAPLVIAAGAVRSPGKIPWIEQQMAVGAACQNLLLAATALGYGSMWRTGEPCYDPVVKSALGLGADDALIGFLYLGSIASDQRDPTPRAPVDLATVVREWKPTQT
jgi:nitroreductase